MERSGVGVQVCALAVLSILFFAVATVPMGAAVQNLCQRQRESCGRSRTAMATIHRTTKFLPPTVFKGLVYMGTRNAPPNATNGQVNVFGLCGSQNQPPCLY
jgi:hypothetical protein